MFGNKPQSLGSNGLGSNEVSQLKDQLRQEKHEREMEKARMEQEKELALKEKEFELKHFKDEEIKKLEKELNDSKQTVAVLKKENEMLDKITNLNADIIDIKDLVANLINKLPEVKISSLHVNGDSK